MRHRVIFHNGEVLQDINFRSDIEDSNLAFRQYCLDNAHIYNLEFDKLQKVCIPIADSEEIPEKKPAHRSINKNVKPYARPIVCIDVETTGLSDKAEIIEFAAIKINTEGKVIGRLIFRCKPKRKETTISKEAYEKHGISLEDLENEKPFSFYIPKINEFIEGCDLAGHNFINFDLPRLETAYKDVNKEFPLPKGRKYYDTYQNYKSNNRLQMIVYREFGSGFENAHNAESDVVATLSLLDSQYIEKGVNSYTPLYDPSGQFVMIDYYNDGKKTLCLAKGRFIKNNNKGKPLPVHIIYRHDRGYLEWLHTGTTHDMSQKTRDIAKYVLEKYEEVVFND